MVEWVVGLTGTIGSGREAVRDVLSKNFSSWYVSLSSVIRGDLERKKKKYDRKILQNSGNELRKKYGKFVLAKVSTDYMQRDKELIIVDGIRNPGEIEYLKKTFGNKFILVAVDAPRETRWERIKALARNEEPKTWEDFVAVDDRDQGVGEDLNGQHVRRCVETADIVIENDGDLNLFNEKITNLINSLKVR